MTSWVIESLRIDSVESIDCLVVNLTYFQNAQLFLPATRLTCNHDFDSDVADVVITDSLHVNSRNALFNGVYAYSLCLDQKRKLIGLDLVSATTRIRMSRLLTDYDAFVRRYRLTELCSP